MHSFFSARHTCWRLSTLPLAVQKIGPAVIFSFLAYCFNLLHSFCGRSTVRSFPFRWIKVYPCCIASAVIYSVPTHGFLCCTAFAVSAQCAACLPPAPDVGILRLLNRGSHLGIRGAAPLDRPHRSLLCRTHAENH